MHTHVQVLCKSFFVSYGQSIRCCFVWQTTMLCSVWREGESVKSVDGRKQNHAANAANAMKKKEHAFTKPTQYPPHTHTHAFLNIQHAQKDGQNIPVNI